jgi:hypothetical protein
MTAVSSVLRFDVAALDQQIRAVRAIRILLGSERGLVVVAIAKNGSGYVVGVKVHASPQLRGRFKRASRDPGLIFEGDHRDISCLPMRVWLYGLLVEPLAGINILT